MQQKFEAWADEFLKSKTAVMDHELTRCMVVCLIEESNPDFPGPEMKDSFLYQVAEGRAAIVGLKLSTAVLSMISCIAESPGVAVMYVYALRYAQRKWAKDTMMMMSDFIDIFPKGFPAETELSRLWDAQKGYAMGLKCDNFLDTLNDPYKGEQACSQ